MNHHAACWTERKRHTDEGHVSTGFQSGDADAGYQRDRARIIHCAAFRRLQSKTQLLNVGASDFYRTRLTHSLEVAQLGSGICTRLAQTHPQWRASLPGSMLMEAICLAHDLGHPPFGHGGEAAINAIMRDHGGFEGNGQTLRIAMRLGEYSEAHGLDLSRRTLLGILKYPVVHSQVARYADAGVQPGPGAGTGRRIACKPPKCIHDDEQPELDWILAPLNATDRQRLQTIDWPADTRRHGRTRYKGLDASIMELADDIAYGVHDLEDAIALGLVSQAQWHTEVVAAAGAERHAGLPALLEFATGHLFQGGDKPRKHAISRLVGFLMERIRIIPQGLFDEPLLDLQARMDDDAAGLLGLLKKFVMQFVILRPQLQELEFKGQQIVTQLMEVLLEQPQRLLPRELQQQLTDGAPLQRTVSDYVASMSDRQAVRHYRRLFVPDTDSFLPF